MNVGVIDTHVLYILNGRWKGGGNLGLLCLGIGACSHTVS